MARIEFKIDEQASDLRSHEFAYRFTVANNGTTPITLMSITPRLPQGVELLEVKTSTAAAAKQRHTELCEQLSGILADQLIVKSESYRMELANARADVAKRYLTNIGGFFKVALGAFWPARSREIQADIRRVFGRIGFRITNFEDAKVAYDRFFASESDDHIMKKLFISKAEQLEKAETQEIGGKIARTDQALAIVEADSFYAATYVLKYVRRLLEPRKYTVSIDVTFQEVGKSEILAGGTSTTVVISPNPVALTIVAIVASLLGAALKFAMQAQPFTWSSLGTFLFKGNAGIAAAICGLVFFNIYEFTDIGKKITFGVGWRSALLVGFLCGLFGERIMDSLKVFIGIK